MLIDQLCWLREVQGRISTINPWKTTTKKFLELSLNQYFWAKKLQISPKGKMGKYCASLSIIYSSRLFCNVMMVNYFCKENSCYLADVGWPQSTRVAWTEGYNETQFWQTIPFLCLNFDFSHQLLWPHLDLSLPEIEPPPKFKHPSFHIPLPYSLTSCTQVFPLLTFFWASLFFFF